MNDDEFNIMVERGTKSWADVPDATEWLENLRGNQEFPDSGSTHPMNLSVGDVTNHGDSFETLLKFDKESE